MRSLLLAVPALVAVLFAAALLPATAPAAEAHLRASRALAPAPAPRPRYVALGDSYSSGQGAGSYLPAADRRPAACLRSRNAYSQILARRLAGRYAHDPARDFLACANHKVDNLIRNQLPLLRSDAGLVTLGIGGNDTGWSEVIQRCIADAFAPWWRKRTCKRILDDALDRVLPVLQTRLAGLYAQIRARARSASVIVVGYPAIFEDGYVASVCPGAGPLSRSARADIRAATERLNDATRAVAQRSGFRFVDPRFAFEDHRVCSPGADWMHGVTLNGSRPIVSPDTFHPNRAGQAGLAAVIAASNRDLIP